MRSFTLNGGITAPRIKQLMRYIELCDSKNVNVYLSSYGGNAWMADIFIDFTYRTKKKITFIGLGRMASACVHIFVEAKGKKVLYPNTIAMIHFITNDPESRNLLNKKSYDSILLENLQELNAKRLQDYSEVFLLTDKEKHLLKKGGDLVINYKRLNECLPRISKYKRI